MALLLSAQSQHTDRVQLALSHILMVGFVIDVSLAGAGTMHIELAFDEVGSAARVPREDSGWEVELEDMKRGYRPLCLDLSSSSSP